MTDINEDDIRIRAYALWEADGCPDGSHDVHWEQALRQLTEEAQTGGVVDTPAKAAPLSVVQNDASAEPAAKKRSKTA